MSFKFIGGPCDGAELEDAEVNRVGMVLSLQAVGRMRTIVLMPGPGDRLHPYEQGQPPNCAEMRHIVHEVDESLRTDRLIRQTARGIRDGRADL